MKVEKVALEIIQDLTFFSSQTEREYVGVDLGADQPLELDSAEGAAWLIGKLREIDESDVGR